MDRVHTSRTGASSLEASRIMGSVAQHRHVLPHLSLTSTVSGLLYLQGQVLDQCDPCIFLLMLLLCLCNAMRCMLLFVLLSLSAQRLSTVAASLPPLAFAVLLPLLLELLPHALTEALAALAPSCGLSLNAAQGEESTAARRALCSCEMQLLVGRMWTHTGHNPASASSVTGTQFSFAAKRCVLCCAAGMER